MFLAKTLKHECDEEVNNIPKDCNLCQFFCTEIDVSVTSESSSSVELCMKIRGLQPKKGVKKLMHKINKPKKQPHPDDLVANAKFNKWNITTEYET